MDGAGRSRRSRGSSEPKTDLKAAAIGAAVLLREYLGLPKARAKTVHDRETPHRAILWLERATPRRAVLMLTLATLLGSAVLGVFKGGHVDAVLAHQRQQQGVDLLDRDVTFQHVAVALAGYAEALPRQQRGNGHGWRGRHKPSLPPLSGADARTVGRLLRTENWGQLAGNNVGAEPAAGPRRTGAAEALER